VQKRKAFLDSTVIIFGLEIPRCNSALLLDLVLEEKLEAVTCEKVIKEVKLYFTRRRNRNYAFLIENLIRKNFYVIGREQVMEQMQKWKGKIKEKDLEQVASVKTLGIRYLIAYDRDFEELEEYITPKRFIKSLGIKFYETEY
jgi:predicted nucleic acid-binding protein